MIIVIQIVLLILLTDLIAGIIHWWEDTYGNPSWKILGKLVVLPNIEHHQFPRKMLQGTTFQQIRLSAFVAILVGIIFSLTIGLNWQILFVLVYGSFGNYFHAVSHRTDNENGKIICFIQKIGLIQSHKMHGLHHKSPYATNYCVMTNYMNPFLNYIQFWRKLETAIKFCFKISPIQRKY